jgi:pimeloyl-ACP methyl ester carboxylesterase
MAGLPNIVLVHGAWADGSCWSDVIERLQADGYEVTAPQRPETSLADDAGRVRHVLARQSGPTVLAAHSYGGQGWPEGSVRSTSRRFAAIEPTLSAHPSRVRRR